MRGRGTRRFGLGSRSGVGFTTQENFVSSGESWLFQVPRTSGGRRDQSMAGDTVCGTAAGKLAVRSTAEPPTK
jgi:hypothetical protein